MRVVLGELLIADFPLNPLLHVFVCRSVKFPKQSQLLVLGKFRRVLLQLVLNVSVVLHRTRHAHKLQFLNAHHHGENICAARTRLTVAIRAARIALCRRERLRLW